MDIGIVQGHPASDYVFHPVNISQWQDHHCGSQKWQRTSFSASFRLKQVCDAGSTSLCTCTIFDLGAGNAKKQDCARLVHSASGGSGVEVLLAV